MLLLTAAVGSGCLPGRVYTKVGYVAGIEMTIDGNYAANDAIYKTVEIGGNMWMAENLNIKTGTSWCYDNEDSKCDRYGRLYDWNTANKVCPAGWRLPTNKEWEALVIEAGGEDAAGKRLKSTNGWRGGGNGTDEYGFSALPGSLHSSNGNFGYPGEIGAWWTATEGGAFYVAYSYGMRDDSDGIGFDVNRKSIGLSVRCLLGGVATLDSTRRENGEERQKREEEMKNEIERRLEKLSDYFTDTRDNRRYRVVKIGGYRWMAENLSYQTGRSWCYGNNNSNCDKYGRLYDWKTAVKACPAGWHLPTSGEWDSLVTAVGGRDSVGGKLKSAIGWNDYKGRSGGGADDYGFSSLPGGRRHINGSTFCGAGDYGYWWTATETKRDICACNNDDDDDDDDADGASANAYRRSMNYYGVNMVDKSNYKGDGLSVRCVEN